MERLMQTLTLQDVIAFFASAGVILYLWLQ